jgi:methylenetetrahydrofolate reductase (NADPH)
MPNSRLKQAFDTGKFVVTAEAGPLKGTDTKEIEEISHLLKGKVDAINVTDQQSSVMRLGSLVTCHLLKDWGVEPIYQLTCRDRNRIALQSDLLSAWVLGVENCVALTGDLPSSGDHPQAKPVYDLDSVQLLHVMKGLNEGHDMVGNELKGKTDFYCGAVVNPGADTEASFELQILKMEKKIAAGAKFFQTQAIFDPKAFEQFIRRTEQYKVPILAGVIPLKSAGMAKFMNKSVAGINVPQAMIDKMTKTEDKTKTGIELCADLIRNLKGMCQGVHIMAIGWEKKVPDILAAAGI